VRWNGCKEVNDVIPRQITVLGGGNTAFRLAANLALARHEVLLWEHPEYADTIEPIRELLTIHLDGSARTGAARLAGVTTDPAEALAWSEILVCSVPSFAHQPFLGQLLPHLKPGHVLALLPGNLGALAVANALREAGKSGVIVAVSDTAPYVCRKSAGSRGDLGDGHRAWDRGGAGLADRRSDAGPAAAFPRRYRVRQRTGGGTFGVEPGCPPPQVC
jgi:ketopantoate reductase